MKITVDIDLCQGHSVCVEEAPDVFEVVENDDSYPTVKVLVADPDEGLRTAVEAAVKYCPNRVIKIVED